MSLPGYGKYRDSGVGWLGRIPSHWDVCALKYVANLRSGESIAAEQIDVSGIYPVYGGNGLRGFTTSFTHEGRFVLIGRQGALCGNINYACGKFWASEHAIVVTPVKILETTWLGELLRTINLNQYSISAAQPGLSVDLISNIQIPFPSQDEQAAIARFLDRETSKIDALIAEQEKLIELLTEKRQATISHAVTRGLNPDVPMKDSGVEWLGEVPVHWDVVGLTKYIESTVDYRGKTPTKVDDGMFLVTAKNIRAGRIDYQASQEYVAISEYEQIMRRGRPAIGDILFTTEAPLGQVAVVDREDIALAQRIIKFRGAPDRLENSFLMAWLMSSSCQFNLTQLATGSTAVGIKGSKLSQVKIVLPPLNEQRAIVNFIALECERLDSLISASERAIGLFIERRHSLITAAVTGQIDVRGAI